MRAKGWLLAFAGFFLCIGAWSLAAPYDGTPDEKEHVLRAYGVVSGQVYAEPAAAVRGGGAFQTVPRSLVRKNCFQHDSIRSAACSQPPGGDRSLVPAGTGAGRYHPVYYGIVGWPLRVSPDWTGLLLARLISAALCAALLANAFTDAVRWSRHRLMVAGVLAAATPMVAHMASAVNPSGLEIAAGVSFFAAVVPMLHHSRARSGTLLWRAGVAALCLATLRSAGPLWLGLSALALVLPLGFGAVRQLWHWRALRYWAAGVIAAGAASAVWTFAAKTMSMGEESRNSPMAISQAFRLEAERWRRYLDEMVGVTAWLDARMPGPAYAVWQFLAAALLVWGFVVAYRSGRWQLVALTAAGVGVPFAMQVLFINSYGFITQGRYLLPVLVGLPILAAFLIQHAGVAQAGLDRDRSLFLLRMYALILLPLHLLCLWFTMVRWQHGMVGSGLRDLDPTAGPWQPPLGPVPPLVLCVAGLVVLGWLVWREPAPQTVQHAAEHSIEDSPLKTDAASGNGRGERETAPAGGLIPARDRR